jgi:hypothetical protein
LIFENAYNQSSGKTQHFNVIDIIDVQERKVDKLSEYMAQFGDKYNLDKVARLPKEKIRIGTIVVQEKDIEDAPIQEYLFILDDFSIDLDYIFEERFDKFKKNYTFMLVIPNKVITDKIDEVHEDVSQDISNVFIIPFALFSLVMMFVISYFLQKISSHITKPIIELF